ncbi:hypothetical protein OAK98_03130 [Mariniblastus sp.]|nr:hypothetical protein [Mariniblastus sp.]
MNKLKRPFASRTSKAFSTFNSMSSAAQDLWLGGTFLVILGVFHILIWLTLGGEWEGPVSWRKPILFGISTGLTLISIGYFFDRLRPVKSDSWLMRLLSVALVLEVVLITMQQWRGQASHFNHDSLLNTLVEYAMTVLIVIATVLLVLITLRTFIYLNTSRDLQVAIRAGMVFLIISCLIGFFILWYGNSQVLAGQDPSKFGNAGVTKFPHGIAIHSLQFFPVLCWLFAKIGLTTPERTRTLQFSIAWMGGLLAYSVLQTLSGRARFDWTIFGGGVFAASMALLIPVVWAVAKRLTANGRNVFLKFRTDESCRPVDRPDQAN